MGIDLEKNIFHLHEMNKRGKAVFSKALTGAKFQKFSVWLSPCLTGRDNMGAAMPEVFSFLPV